MEYKLWPGCLGWAGREGSNKRSCRSTACGISPHLASAWLLARPRVCPVCQRAGQARSWLLEANTCPSFQMRAQAQRDRDVSHSHHGGAEEGWAQPGLQEEGGASGAQRARWTVGGKDLKPSVGKD